MTTQFAFDTLAFVKRLSASGMAKRQAEALAEALTADTFNELVTKPHLESALDKLELRLTIRMGVLTAATITILGALITLS